MSPPISQAFPGNALERVICALRISYAKRSAIVVSEVELGDITLKMLLTNLMICTDQAALEDVEEALGGIAELCT